MNKFRFVALISIIISACGKPPENYKFNNDLENINGWFDRKDIVKGDAHSGNYSCVITPEADYGITFRRRLADLNNGSMITQIRAGAWIKFPDIDSKGTFVVSIDEPSDFSPIVFLGVKLQEQITEPGKWQYVTNKVNVPANIDLNKVVSIYVTNDGKNNIYADDISYDFE